MVCVSGTNVLTRKLLQVKLGLHSIKVDGPKLRFQTAKQSRTAVLFE